MAVASRGKPRGYSTICLPIRKDLYHRIIDSPRLFRRWLDRAFQDAPELFPKAFAQGYTLKDSRISRKRGLRLRRIRCRTTGAAFSIRPCFLLPYMTAWTDDASRPLFLRAFGVPFWALAHVFGRDATYWYRLEVGLGLKQAKVPSLQGLYLLADDDVLSLSCPPMGSSSWTPFCLAHDPHAFLLNGSERQHGSEHPDSDFKRTTFNTVTRPTDGRRSIGTDSRPTSGTPTSDPFVPTGRADERRHSRTS
jgi:hypothetical protein